VRAGIRGSGVVEAPALALAVAEGLDEYAHNWVASFTDACEATRIRGEQSEALLDARMSCLDQRRRELDDVADILEHDASAGEHSLTAVSSLTRPERCDKVTALGPRSTADPARLEALKNKLARIPVESSVKGTFRPIPELNALADEARALGATDLLASALLDRAYAEGGLGQFAAAEGTFHEAVFAATLAHDEWAIADGWGALIGMYGGLHRYSEGERAAQYAKEAIDRMGGNKWLEWKRLAQLSAMLEVAERFADAEKAERRAIELMRTVPQHSVREEAIEIAWLGRVLADEGKFDEGRHHYDEALHLLEQVPGQEMLRVHWESDLAEDDAAVGHFDDAIARERRVVAYFERARPQPVGALAYAQSSLGGFLVKVGQLQEGLELLDHVCVTFEKELGPSAIEIAWALNHIAEGRLKLGQIRVARPLLERALSLQLAPDVADSQARAETEWLLAKALKDVDAKRAGALARHALEVMRKRPLGSEYAKAAAELESLFSTATSK
jgi:tetratricopeptide (TPR) repeat protein